mgnify:CR=1 FL=1
MVNPFLFIIAQPFQTRKPKSQRKDKHSVFGHNLVIFVLFFHKLAIIVKRSYNDEKTLFE